MKKVRFKLKSLKARAHETLDEIMENTVDKLDLISAGSQGPASVGKTELQQELAAESQATIPGGRRRGRRKVMKKKTLKDDEGYLGSLTRR